MDDKMRSRVILFSLIFVFYWFFGNLYEEIVLVPNLLVDTREALRHWQAFFRVSLPTYYYVPITQIAIFAIWYLYFSATENCEKLLLKRASLCSLLGIIITVVIVTQINLKLFFGDLIMYSERDLFQLSILWLVGNLLRLILVGISGVYLFKIYTTRQIKRTN